jgi:hypothetical protein
MEDILDKVKSLARGEFGTRHAVTVLLEGKVHMQ